MYEFHYNHIKSTYDNRAALLMTDTDSLVYSIETDDLYDDLYHHLDLYDTSEYPNDHRAYSKINKKVLGENEGRDEKISHQRVCWSLTENVFGVGR